METMKEEKKEPLVRRWLTPYRVTTWENISEEGGRRWHKTTFERTYNNGDTEVNEKLQATGVAALLSLRELIDTALMRLRERNAELREMNGLSKENTPSSD